MKKIATYFFAFLLCSSVIFGQRSMNVLREVFQDAEYFLMQEYYIDALAEYQKLYIRGYQDNANINYRMGICYINIPGQKEQAIPHLEKSVLNVTSRYAEGSFSEERANTDAWLYLGNAYRINNELDKAIEAYGKYKSFLREGDIVNIKYVEQQIEACNHAIEMQNNPINVSVKNLGPVINNANANFKPILSGDESVLVYMNRLRFYDAVYISRKVDGEWSGPENITPQLQSDGDQSTTFLSYDGNTLYLTKEDRFNSVIHMSRYIDGTWTKSEPLGKNINTKFWESHASVTADGKIMYFASNRRGGEGAMDIYKSHLDENGHWGPPVNLGKTINTPLNEDTPFITPDGNTLFFSSQGHYNMGGYDIFYANRIGENQWSEPVNIGYPINTTDDDLFYVPVGNHGNVGYMAKFHPDGYGELDILRIEILPEEDLITPEITKDIEEEMVAQEMDVTEPDTEWSDVAEDMSEDATDEISFIIKPVFFEFDDFMLSLTAKEDIKALMGALEFFDELIIEVIGHTDSKGSPDYNMKLAEKRARSVVDYLAKNGVEMSRLRVVSRGESSPVAVNSNPDGTDNPEGRKLNRRVEFNVARGGTSQVTVEKVEVPENLKPSNN